MHTDCCRLIALNFMSAVEDPFKPHASINYNTIEKVAYEQQVLLDNLVDLEIEHINSILNKVKEDDEDEKYKRVELETWKTLKNSAKKYRRTGGGFTALADALAAVGVEYGTEYGNHVVDRMMQAKFKGEWNASIDLSIQRGSFPEWNHVYDDTEFFDMIQEEFPTIYKRNQKYGRRNISLSTVAPTGSVSLMSNINGEYSTSSGVEPVFSTEEYVLWHTRNKKLKEDSDEYDYIGEDGNKWKQYKVFHEGFRQWLIHNEGYDPEDVQGIVESSLKVYAKESPYVTSAGLDYEQRIKLQSIVQKYTTHSISSTLNLPEDADWENTLDIYNKAYDHDLKGVTIFRNGSKRGVLESTTSDDGRGEQIEYHDAPERPKKLDAKVHVVRNKWSIIVGFLEERPYEVFVTQPENLDLIKENLDDQLAVKKLGSKRYDLDNEDDNSVILTDILNYSPSSNADVLTRFTSQLMRHGVKMDYIVEQVRKADITINDFSKILGDVLTEYTSSEYEPVCKNCGATGNSIQRVEGCLTCKECGHSKCG